MKKARSEKLVKQKEQRERPDGPKDFLAAE
jgi:hypothetical protein